MKPSFRPKDFYYMHLNRFCKAAETEISEMAQWRVLVFDTMTTALARALIFFEECPRVDQHKRLAKCGEDWLMDLQKYLPYDQNRTDFFTQLTLCVILHISALESRTQ